MENRNEFGQYSEYRVREPPNFDPEPRIIRDESPKIKKRRRDYLEDIYTEFRENKRLKIDQVEDPSSEPYVLPKSRLMSGDTSPTGLDHKILPTKKNEGGWGEDSLFGEIEEEEEIWPTSPFYNDVKFENKKLRSSTIFEPETPKTLEDEEQLVEDLMFEDFEDGQEPQPNQDDEDSSRRTIHLDLSDDEDEEKDDKVFVTFQSPSNNRNRPQPIKIKGRTMHHPPNIIPNKKRVNSTFFLHTPSKKYESFMNSPNHRPKIRVGEEFQAEIPPMIETAMTPEVRRSMRDQSQELYFMIQQNNYLSHPSSSNEKLNRIRGGELCFNGPSFSDQEQRQHKELDEFMRISKTILSSTKNDDDDCYDDGGESCDSEEHETFTYTEMLVDVLRKHNFDFGKSLMYVQKNLENMRKQRDMEIRSIREFCDHELWW